MHGIYVTLWIFQIYSALCHGDSVVDIIRTETALLDSLLNESIYDKRLGPSIDAKIGGVLSHFQMYIYGIKDLNEEKGYLEMVSVMTYAWNDYRLVWNLTQYNRIASVRLPREKLWTPQLYPFNNYDHEIRSGTEFVQVNFNGGIIWNLFLRIKTACRVDITRFPYDKTTCTMRFGAFNYETYMMNKTMSPRLVNSNLIRQNPRWTIQSTKTYPKMTRRKKKVYQYRFEFTLRRNDAYSGYVFVMPPILVSLLVTFQFLMQPQAKERFIICGTSLIFMTSLFSSLQEAVPSSHYGAPNLVLYYCLTIVWIVISLGASAVVMNIAQNRFARMTFPVMLRNVIQRFLKKVLLVGDVSTVSKELDEFLTSEQANGSTYSEDLPQPQDQLGNDVRDILDDATVISSAHVSRERLNRVSSEWYEFALVIDRMMFTAFTCIFVISSCVLLA